MVEHQTHETSAKALPLRNMILCALFTALIAIGAFIKIPVPEVPFTMQFLFANLAGLLLHRRWGAGAALLYVLLGLIGLPIFTKGGGLGYVFQPSFGYLMGFIVGAWLCGFIVERSKAPGFKTFLLAGVANLAVVYTLGVVYLYFIKNVYMGAPMPLSVAVIYGALIFMPGDLFWTLVSAYLGKRLHPVLHTSVSGKRDAHV